MSENEYEDEDIVIVNGIQLKRPYRVHGDMIKIKPASIQRAEAGESDYEMGLFLLELLHDHLVTGLPLSEPLKQYYIRAIDKISKGEKAEKAFNLKNKNGRPKDSEASSRNNYISEMILSAEMHGQDTKPLIAQYAEEYTLTVQQIHNIVSQNFSKGYRQKVKGCYVSREKE